MAGNSGTATLDELIGADRARTLTAAGRQSLLLTETGEVLWASPEARALFGLSPAGKVALPGGAPGLNRLKGFARMAATGERLRETLRMFVQGRLDSLRSVGQKLELADGSAALLCLFGDGPELDLPARLPAAQAAVTHAVAHPQAPAIYMPSAPDEPHRSLLPVAAAPVPAVAPAVHQPALPAPQRPTRFVFLTDADGTLVSISPAFAQMIGRNAKDLAGQNFSDLIADIDPARAAEIARAMHGGATWNGIAVDWPVEDGARTARIEFSAMPAFDASRTLSGYNGFGLMRMEPISTVSAATAPVAPASAELTAGHVAAQPAPLTDQAADLLDEVADADEDGRGYEAAVERLEAILEDDEVIEIAGTTRDGAPEHVALALPTEEATPAHDAGDEAPELDLIPPVSQEASAVAPAHPLEEAPAVEVSSPAPVAHAKNAPVVDAPQPAPARQDNGPTPGQTVVPLRNLKTHVGATLGEQKVVPLKNSGPVPVDAEHPRLSHSERNAFREIARALGARLEDGEATTPAAPAPVAPLPTPPAAAAEPPAGPNHVAAAQAEISKALAAAHAHQDERAREGLGTILVERMPVGVLVFRGDRPLYLNRMLLDLLNYEDLTEFDALRGLEKLFRGRAAPSHATGDFDTVAIVGRDGGSVPVDAHLQAIDWNGEHATMVTFRRAIDTDNTPRVKALDLELQKRQADVAEARAMLDTATDGVISLDETGRILALNKSAEALFGYDQNELTGERLTLLLAPESHAAALDYLDGLKTGGVASVLNDGREIVGRERKGGRIPLFMTIGRISETGKFAAVLRDLTAWKRAESELTEAKRAAERASALKSDFLAKVSHEIRTPMNAIIGFAEVMRDERLGPIGTERYKDYLKDIHTSGEHVISLVNDLLDLSKIEAGRMELAFGSVDLNAIVTSCLGIMQPQSTRDRVIMRSQLSAKLPPVVADERSVRQIVLNLLSNASKFTEAGGQVIVSTALTDQGEAVIRVRDTGVGMTDQEVVAAMEPFRQLSNARGRGGTGLGLPLTKALVEANRAVFNIRSKVREGTLVEVIFPPTRVLAE